MTSSSSSTSFPSPKASASGLARTLTQDQLHVEGSGNEATAARRSSSADCRLANVPAASSGDPLQVRGPDITGPESRLDETLENLKKVHAELMELARSSGAIERSSPTLSSSEDIEDAEAADEKMDVADDGSNSLSESATDGSGPDAISACVRKEVKLLQACWQRLLFQNSPCFFSDEAERLEIARQNLDQRVRLAQQEEQTRRHDEWHAWLASSGAKADELKDPIWEGETIKQPIDELHGSFLEKSRDIPRNEATHVQLMRYVLARLRLLLSFMVDLNHYTENSPEIRDVISIDKNTLPTLKEFAGIVKDLPLKISQAEGLKQTRIKIAELGKYVPDSSQRCWFSLERPDIYCNRYPGLRRLKEALLIASANAPANVRNYKSFSLMFARVVNEEQIDAQTVAYLGRRFEGLRAYMAMALRQNASERGGVDLMDDAEDLDDLRAVVGSGFARDLQGAAKLAHAIETNSQGIKNLIDKFGKLGFPVHWSELLALMAGAGVKMSRNQLAVVPGNVEGVALRESWFFPSEEQPQKLKNFKVTSMSTILFRGRPAGVNEKNNIEGWCERMVRLHPRGLSGNKCIEVLEKIAPTETQKKLGSYWGYWKKEKFVLPVAKEDRWIPNPEFLCRSASECLRREAGIETGGSLPISDDQRRPGGPHQREPNKEVTRQSQYMGAVIEKLQNLDLMGEIERFYINDISGLAFQRVALTKFLQKELGLSKPTVEAALGDLRPVELRDAAQGKQWMKPRWNFSEMPGVLKNLHRNCHFFVFMSNSFIAKEINRLNPDRYMPAASLGEYLKIFGPGSGDALGAIKRLVDNEEIGYFYHWSGSLFVSPSQILNYLGLHDIFVNSSELATIFDKFSSEIIRQKPKFPKIFFCSKASEKRLGKVIDNFKLQRGSAPPGWNEFIAYYEKEICNGVKPYFGRKAGDLYVSLQNWLADDPAELQKFMASTKVKKRKTLPTTAAASIQDAGSASKKSRGPSRIAPHSMHAMPRVNSNAWGTVALPSDMSTTFDGFLAQYQQLPRTLPMVRDTSTAATISGGVPLAASLRAGFRDTVTAQFVDMRSHLPAAGLYARESPGDGDCLFTALLTDDQLSTSQAQALRRQVAVALHGMPDTPAQSARNAREVANYLFQRDEHNAPQQSLGIDEVPNRVRAGLEVLDGMYSDADLTIPLFCRLLDERAAPGTPPANVMLLSEMDGHVVIFTAFDRTAILMRHLSPVELQQTLRDLCAASAAMVILRGAHFDRVQPM